MHQRCARVAAGPRVVDAPLRRQLHFICRGTLLLDERDPDTEPKHGDDDDNHGDVDGRHCPCFLFAPDVLLEIIGSALPVVIVLAAVRLGVAAFPARGHVLARARRAVRLRNLFHVGAFERLADGDEFIARVLGAVLLLVEHKALACSVYNFM